MAFAGAYRTLGHCEAEFRVDDKPYRRTAKSIGSREGVARFSRHNQQLFQNRSVRPVRRTTSSARNATEGHGDYTLFSLGLTQCA